MPWPTGRAPSAVLFPTGFAANLGVLTTFGGPDVLVCSDELNHASIIDGCRLAHADGRGVPPRGSRAPRWLLYDATGVAVRSCPTPCSRWTATSPTSTGSHDRCVGTALLVIDEAHAVLGPELPSATTGSASTSMSCCRHVVEDAGRWAGSSPRRRRSRSDGQPGPFVHLHDRDTPRPIARPRALGVLTSPRRRALVDRLRSHVERVCDPATAPRSSRSCAATTIERSTRPPALLATRASLCRGSARHRAGRVPARLHGQRTPEQIDLLVERPRRSARCERRDT